MSPTPPDPPAPQSGIRDATRPEPPFDPRPSSRRRPGQQVSFLAILVFAFVLGFAAYGVGAAINLFFFFIGVPN